MKTFNFRKLSAFLMIVTALGALTDCGKSSPQSPSQDQQEQEAQQQAETQKQQIEQELTQKNEDLEKQNAALLETQKTYDEKEQELEKAQQDLDKQKSDFVKEVQANNKEETVRDVILSSQSPIEEMATSLSQGHAVPVLFDFYGPSLQQIHSIETGLASLNVDPRFYRYINDRPDVASNFFSSFLIVADSIERFRDFEQSVHKNYPDTRMIILPVKQVLARSYLQLSYRRAGLITGENFTKLFWIGDSQPAAFENASSLSSLFPYFNNCALVTASCFKTLISENYFHNTWIDGSTQNPLEFLKKELGESAYLLNDKGLRGSFSLQSPQNSIEPVIQDIKLITHLWVVSPDVTYVPEISKYHDAFHASVSERWGDQGIYEAPVSYQSEIPANTNNHLLNVAWATNQLHDYLCSFMVCPPVSKTH